MQKFKKNGRFEPFTEPFLIPASFVRAETGITRASTPFSILQKLLTEEIMGDVVRETNDFAAKLKRDKPTTLPKWKDTSVPEIWQFLAVNLMMGVVKKSAIRDYWEKDALLETPGFREKMTRDRFEGKLYANILTPLDKCLLFRFQSLLRALHFVDKDAPTNAMNRFGKLGNFLPKVFQQFEATINPGQDLTIDESLLAFNGRLSIKQYNPLKRGRFGIKIFMLADTASGFIFGILPYQGKGTRLGGRNWRAEYGFGGAAVLTLLQPHLNRWHRVTLDNYFMSYVLVKKLLTLKTHALGTVKKNRKGLPKMTTKLAKGAVETYSDGKVLLER